MPFAVLEFLKELRLRLVVEVCILDMLDIFHPDGRVLNLRMRLYCLTDTLADCQGYGHGYLSKLGLLLLYRVSSSVH